MSEEETFNITYAFLLKKLYDEFEEKNSQNNIKKIFDSEIEKIKNLNDNTIGYSTIPNRAADETRIILGESK